jgi:hypothetical protein
MTQQALDPTLNEDQDALPNLPKGNEEEEKVEEEDGEKKEEEDGKKKEENGEGEEEEKEEDGEGVEEDGGKKEDMSVDSYEGFNDDPFVRAAAMFREQEYLGIIELLTEAVETGKTAWRYSKDQPL